MKIKTQDMKEKTKIWLKIAVSVFLALWLVPSSTVLLAQSNDTVGTNTTITAGINDITDPSDVENLEATAGDGEALLKWAQATDNLAITGYKIYVGTHSVQSNEDSYDLPEITVGTVTQYTVKNLVNGQTYYFSAIAIDAAGNESANYASEASATPQAGLRAASIEDDGKSPQVKDVSAEDVITVKVVFSEPIALPQERPSSAFKIEKIADKSRLIVQKAEIDARDSTGQTVLLTTAPQEKDAEYLLTAGIEIQDYFKNHVNSGTSDTGSFKGSGKNQPPKEPEPKPTEPKSEPEITLPPASDKTDADAPLITGASADFNNRITVNFSEQVVLPANPNEQFLIKKKGTEITLKILNVSLSVDGKTIYITTEPQASVNYEVVIKGVKDAAGNNLSDKSNSVEVKGRGPNLNDLIPPEDVTNLIAQIRGAEKNIVELRWKASKNTAQDLADQIVYQSEGKNTKDFNKGTSLGSSATATQLEDLEEGKWYTFKITTKDTSGNESKGAFRAVYLPQTGPGILAAVITGLAMGLYRKRKR